MMYIAPTQLWPNSWGFLRAFELVGKYFNFIPSYKLFFFFYQRNVKKSVQSSHITLSALNSFRRFEAYASHYKNWHDKFFKIYFPHSVPQLFSHTDGRPKFPFYWFECPQVNFSVELDALTDYEKQIVSFLCQIPIIDCKELFACAK